MDTWRSILDPTCLGPRHVGSLEFSPRVCIYILRYLVMGPKSKHETDLLHTHTHAYTHTCTHTHMHTHTQTHPHTHAYAYIGVHIHPCNYAHTQ